MIRPSGIGPLVIAGLVAVMACEPGYAQPATEPAQCASWLPVSTDKPGDRRMIAPVKLGNGRSDMEVDGTADVPGLGPTPGTFVIGRSTFIGLLPNADGALPEPYPFTTMLGSVVSFKFTDPRRGSILPIFELARVSVTGGRLKAFALPPDIKGIACVRSVTASRYEEPAKSLFDRMPGFVKEPPGPGPGRSPEAPGKSLQELFGVPPAPAPRPTIDARPTPPVAEPPAASPSDSPRRDLSISAGDSDDRSETARLDYDRAEKVGSRRAWEAFLALHPTGFYAELAREQLAKLEAPKPGGAR